VAHPATLSNIRIEEVELSHSNIVVLYEVFLIKKHTPYFSKPAFLVDYY
jgi:hypothetical protein